MFEVDLQILNSGLLGFHSTLMLIVKNSYSLDMNISEIGFADKEKNVVYKAAVPTKSANDNGIVLYKDGNLSYCIDTEMLDREKIAFVYIKSGSSINFYTNRNLISIIDE